MAASVIGALRANLGLDSAQFVRGATRAQKTLGRMRSQFLAVTAVVAGLGTALSAVALRGAADIDRLVKGGRRIDGTANALQALELAGSEAGVSISSLTNDVQTMNRELSSGSTGAESALKRLSLSAADLAAMDADERVATIADRVKELGLSAGQATDLLRDLGVRNREMALLMIQGGDAIRRARDDVRDYGLEIDDALGAKIEQANDRIGRLGIVAQLFGQRMAAEIVPTLGAFAQIMTDSMREGGLLRNVVEGLAGSMSALVSIAAVAVAAFGVRYVGALALATFSTASLSGALVALRTALLRTGIGALVVGAGVLLDQFVKLRVSTGSWGEALEALGRIAKGVWDGVSTSAAAMLPALQAIFEDIKAGFFQMAAEIQWRWSELLGAIAQGMRQIPFIGDEIADKIAASGRSAAEGWEDFNDAARGAAGAADQLRAQAAQMASAGFDTARAALADLNSIINRNTGDTTAAADAARELAQQLDAAGGGGGGGARGAAGGLNELSQAAQEAAQNAQQLESAFESAFTGFVTGAQSAKQAAGQLLQQLAKLLANSAFQSLFGGLFSGGGLFAGLFDKGGHIPSGQVGIVGEYGPEFVRGPAMVTSRADTARALRGGAAGPSTMNITVNVDGANGDQHVIRLVHQGVSAGLQQYDRAILPARVAQVSRDPRARGR